MKSRKPAPLLSSTPIEKLFLSSFTTSPGTPRAIANFLRVPMFSFKGLIDHATPVSPRSGSSFRTEYETSCAYANFASSAFRAEAGLARLEPDFTWDDFNERTRGSVVPHAANNSTEATTAATGEKKRRCDINTFWFVIILQTLTLRIRQHELCSIRIVQRRTQKGQTQSNRLLFRQVRQVSLEFPVQFQWQTRCHPLPNHQVWSTQFR